MSCILALFMAAAVVGNNDLQLFYFGSTWCEPCRQMEPVMERLAAVGVSIRKVDIDQHPDFASQMRVSAVPSLVLVEGSRILDRIDQFATYEDVLAMLERNRAAESRRLAPAANVDSKSARELPTSSSNTTIRGQSPPGRLEQMSNALAGAVRGDRISATRGVRPNIQNESTAALRNSSSGHASNSLTPEIASLSASQPTNQTRPRPGNALQSALAATVRLRVEDADGHSFGTGTVIDVHGNEALIVTCAHLFRDTQGKGLVHIDRFDGPASQATLGTVVSYDLDLDVALVSTPIARPIQPVPLALNTFRPSPGEPVFSVGCNHGETPTVMAGQVNQVDKYLGPPNITASGRPVDGRSGGGLFSQDGRLIGVCNAADPEIDEGLYAAIPRVYLEMDRSGLSFVYERNGVAGDNPAQPNPTSLASLPNSRIASDRAAVAIPDQPSEEVVPSRTPSNPASESGAGMGSRSAIDLESQTRLGSEELVCVVRTQRGDSEVFVVPNPSPNLMNQLKREAELR